MDNKPIDNTQPEEVSPNLGKTTIAPEVLLTIAQLATLEVDGVSHMSNMPSGVNRLFNRGYGEGVRIDIHDDAVVADIHIILQKDVNIRDVSRKVQHDVARAISEMVGMNVGRVNVHIEDIDYPSEIEESHPEEV